MMSKFTIPSLAEIKAANKISSKSEPSLFKASSRTSSAQPHLSASSSGAAAQSTSAPGEPGHSAPTSAAVRKSGKTDKQVPSICLDSGDSNRHSTKVLPEVLASQGLTTASKEGTNDELDRRHVGQDQQNTAAVAIVLQPSSSASASAAQVSTYRPHAIIVNVVQKKNPLMKHIRNVPWEVGNIVPDFELGKTTCALFLSVRYHSLHPNYVHDRLKSLGKQYQLRVLLVLVDTSESQKVLHELARIALLADLTLILSWSYEEAARYLETYKAYENKPPDLIMERIDSDSSSRAIECLTTVKKVNKTDAATLMNTFKTMEKLVTASKEELTLCPGLGPLKAQRLHDLFHEPFLRSAAKKSSVE